MKRTIRTTLAILSFLVAIVVAVSVVYRLGESRTSGERYASSEYSIFRNAVMSAQTPQDFTDQFLQERLKSLYSASQQLLAAQILDQTGAVIWQVPSKSTYFAPASSSGAQPGFSAPTWSTTVFSTPLDGGMKLLALYATISVADIRADLITPFVVLVTWIAFAIAISLVLRIQKKSKKAETVDDFLEQANENEADQGKSNEGAPEQEEPDEFEEMEEVDKETEVDAQDEGPKGSEEPADEEDEAASDDDDLASRIEEVEFGEELQAFSAESSPSGENSEPNPVREEIENEEEPLDSTPEPEPLLSEASEPQPAAEPEPEPEPEVAPETASQPASEPPSEEGQSDVGAAESVPAQPGSGAAGSEPPLASEQAPEMEPGFNFPLELTDPRLEGRLASELQRVEVADIALMLIHYDLLSSTDPAGPALSVTIKDYFGVRDLIFDLGNCDFAIILPGMDIGACLATTEDLIDVLGSTLSLYHDFEGDAPIYIGISSRANRNVDVFRVYREASKAVEAAYRGKGSKILAFKPKSA